MIVTVPSFGRKGLPPPINSLIVPPAPLEVHQGHCLDAVCRCSACVRCTMHHLLLGLWGAVTYSHPDSKKKEQERSLHGVSRKKNKQKKIAIKIYCLSPRAPLSLQSGEWLPGCHYEAKTIIIIITEEEATFFVKPLLLLTLGRGPQAEYKNTSQSLLSPPRHTVFTKPSCN